MKSQPGRGFKQDRAKMSFSKSRQIDYLGLPFAVEWLIEAAMKRFALLSILIGFGLGACEKHDFEGPNGTKRLHQHHDSHGEHGDEEAPH